MTSAKDLRKLNYYEPNGWININKINESNNFYDYICFHHYRKNKN